MSLPYTLRLLCLCGASFFMIHIALSVATRLSAGTAMRVAERLKASSAARVLFAVRMLPFSLTLIAVVAFCIPSYLWLEPDATNEKVGVRLFFGGAAGRRNLGAGNRAGSQCSPWYGSLSASL